MISEISKDFTDQMTNMAMHCAKAVLRMGGTIYDFQRFMDDADNEDLVRRALRMSGRSGRRFFENRFHLDSFKPTKNGLFNRLDTLLSSDPFFHATAGESTFDLRTALDDRKVVIFNLARMGKRAVPAFGKFLVAYIQGLALQRDEHADNTPIHLFVDECQNFITKSYETILNEARKFGLFMTLAQQQVGYGMSRDLIETILTNCNVVLAGRNSDFSERKIATRARIERDDLSQLATGKFLLYVDSRRTETPAFTVKVKSDLRDDSHSMSSAQWERVVEQQLKRYYRPIDTLEQGRTGDDPPDEPDIFTPKY